MILARVAHRNSSPGDAVRYGSAVCPVVARRAGAGVVVAEAVGVAVEVKHDGAVQERSSMAAATVVSPRISPQASTPRLVVGTMLVLV
jgi:hypothetical protein